MALIASGTLAACSSSGGSAGSTDSAGAAGGSMPKVTLRLGDYLASSDPWTKWAQTLAAKVSADTNGAVKIQVYPDGQLVSQASYLQAIHSGSVDLTVAGDSELATISPGAAGLAASDVPFRDQSWTQADAITLSSEVRDDQNAALKSSGVAILSTCTEGFSAVVTKKPVATVGDLEGQKIRVAAPADADIMKALGANPTQIAIGDTYEALQLSTVEGSFSTIPNIFGQQWYKAAKNVDDLPVRMANESLVINLNGLAKVSSSEQQILQKDAADATQSCDDAVQAAVDKDEQSMQAAGAAIVKPTDISGFVSATAAVRDAADSATPLATKLATLEKQIVASTK
ncbi:TRAP transporter substrate-binding protein [Jatrophihabitans sp. DSM 45814]